ncbi:MAG: EVE domain-containing protein [Bacteroidaceae bacterium]|nr:EVE domain-containing protein [Bacteroidaceae bacterium]
MDHLDAKIKSGELECANYAEFSQLAYEGTSTRDTGTEYWIYSPGENASKWELCINDGIMCIGWDVLGDLSDYSSRDEMQKQIKLHYPSKGSAKNDTLAVWQFSNEVKPGDIVFAKKGRNTIIGRGVVESDYEFDESRDDYKHIRKVNWTNIGEWFIDDAVAVKTLTNITRDTDYITKLNNLVDGTSEEVSETEESHETADVNYWWLVGNPNIWSLAKMKVGEEVYYSLRNKNGHQRRIFQNFIDAKKGDIVIGYESTPTKQIVSLFEVSKANDGKVIWFKKIENLSEPIDFSTLKGTAGLENMEYMKNQQGTLFKVSVDEYDIIMEMIRGGNPEPTQIQKEKYSKSEFLDEVFVFKDDFDSLENLLLRKKNLILQGAPGVGKTFAARRLAYAMMGEKDKSRVMQVQFHQNYCYEDFVMGYKPNEEGGFDLKNGIFYRFCKRASNDSERKYFFIIDEINRGNLSKIFGELLMLIENDYRDKPIHMAYRDEEFAVPANLYIIGMMNTADRSLAMIDYALRRRFSFFEMKPGFENPIFRGKIKKQNDPQLESLVKAIIELNKVIENDDSLGSGFCIGHSYLCNMGDQYNLANIVEYDIVSMLSEYWFDNNERFNQEAQKLRNALK